MLFSVEQTPANIDQRHQLANIMPAYAGKVLLVTVDVRRRAGTVNLG